MSEGDASWFSALFAGASVGLKVVHLPDVSDPDSFQYVACNQAAAEALSLPRDQIVGARLLQLFPAARGTEVIHLYQRCVRDQVHVPIDEASYPREDGTLDWFRAHLLPLDAHHVGVVMQRCTVERLHQEQLKRTFAELEARVEARTRDLEQARDRLHAVLAHAPDRIFEVDGDGALTFGIGAHPEAHLVDFCGEEHAEELGRALAEAREAGLARRMLWRDGPPQQMISVSLAPVRSEEEPRFVVIVRDLTHAWQLEQDRHARERAALLGTVMVGIGHEVNNPLGFMQLHIERLRQLSAVSGDPEAAQLVEELAFGAGRIREVVYTMSELVQGQDRPPEPMQLAEAVGDAVRLARHRVERLARLEQRLEEVPSVHAHLGDVGQILLNLMGNALEAIADRPEPRILVEVFADASGTCVAVEDNGPGLSEADAARVFDPYWTSRPGDGMGLGLAISQMLAHRNGATLTYDAHPGEGARFVVRFPPEPARAGGIQPTVLVIDDEALLRRAIAATLPEYTVVQCASYGEGIAALEADRFDAVLCDLALDGKRGEDLWLEVRRSRPDQAARFLFITGGAGPLGLPEACPRTIRKPFTGDGLRQALDEVMARAVRTPGPPPPR